MIMFSIRANNFSLEQIADSGQCFRMKRSAAKVYTIISGDRYVKAYQLYDQITFSCSYKEYEDYWKKYLDLDSDADYIAIDKLINKSNDEYIKKAYAFGSGIRILKQDTWEMIISYIISQNNNIPRIKKTIEKICRKYGKLISEKDDIYSFPTPDMIDENTLEDDELGLGYRAEYLKNIISYIKEHPEYITTLELASYEKAVENLKGHKGIGPKVSNCICLFALHHTGAFPIDTHIKKIIKANYPDGFDNSYYGDYQGIVQQYMFYYDLNNEEDDDEEE